MTGRLLLGVVACVAGTALTCLAQTPGVDLPATGAQIDRATFRYERRIPAGPPGATTVLLDAAALAHSRLADLRLVTADGHQVPYLLETGSDKLRVMLPAPERVDRRAVGDRDAAGRSGTQSAYRLHLPEAHLPVARLVIETDARVFERELAVVVGRSDEGRNEPASRTVATASWRNTDPDVAAPPLVLELPSLAVRDAFLIVDEGDNRRLPIDLVTLELPAYRLRFLRGTQDALWLAYGNPDIAAPRYDLALLAPQLQGSPATEVTPGPERETAQARRMEIPRQVFWGVLVAAIVALLVLVRRLVQTPPAGP